MTRLGELLVAQGLVSARAVEEALEAQVVQGGRLGTNLVEQGHLTEKDLARMLGTQHGVAFASGEMIPDPRALELVDAQLADDKDVLPMRVDATRLSLAVINPRDLETLDAIAFKTGKRIQPVVIPEFRMNQLLRRYCKAFRTIRAIDMHAVKPAKQRPAEGAGADLMSEDEFQSLYAQALSGGREASEEVIIGEEVVDTPPAPPTQPASFSPSPTPAPLPPSATPPVPEPAPPAPPMAEQPSTPLSFQDAQAQLARSSDREDIARTVLRFAVGKWKRALLLSVQAPIVTGWHGMGDGVRDRAVQRMALALRGKNTFKLVCQTRAHYVGPVFKDASAAVFYKLLGGSHPTTAVILPLLARGKVVHLLYVDNGPGQLTPPDVGELLILALAVGRSYEQLIQRRKAAAS